MADRLLILLRPPPYKGRSVGWKMDGRTGTARIGSSQRSGFALLRDPDKGLIAFHAVDDSPGPAPAEPTPTDQIVIAEEAFEPAF